MPLLFFLLFALVIWAAFLNNALDGYYNFIINFDLSQLFDPDNIKRGWFGDVGFNDRSQIVRYAKQLGIEWQKEWYKFVGTKNQYRKVDWAAIPDEIQLILKNERAEHKKRCKCRVSAKKHKYAYILGSNKKETKALKKIFFKNNPDIKKIDYPKERGLRN